MYWQIYHSSSTWEFMIPPNSESGTFGFSTDLDSSTFTSIVRHNCDLTLIDVFPMINGFTLQYYSKQIAEYSAIIPLSFNAYCFYSPITSHPGMGFGSWKTHKYPRTCNDVDFISHIPWNALPKNYLLFWNSDLKDDLEVQANEFHLGNPSLFEILKEFFHQVFQYKLPKISGPNPCCSHFYGDPESLVLLAKLQVLSLLYFDTQYPISSSVSNCPYETWPKDQTHRCWAFGMERITSIYAFLTGKRWHVNKQTCGIYQENIPLFSLFPDYLIHSVWDTLICAMKNS